MGEQEVENARLQAGHSSIYTELMITQFNAKLDLLAATQKLHNEAFLAAMNALRELVANRFNDLETRTADHELRLRVQEARRYVEPRTVWTAISVLVAAIGVAVAIIGLIAKG